MVDDDQPLQRGQHRGVVSDPGSSALTVGGGSACPAPDTPCSCPSLGAQGTELRELELSHPLVSVSHMVKAEGGCLLSPA